MEDAHTRKRPRPVVSCLRCRDKKLKCDRTTPCENCVKAHTADACTYSKNTHIFQKEPTPNPPPSINFQNGDAVEDLQARMSAIEELLGVNRRHPVPHEGDRVAPHVLGTVVVKGTRTVYHGQNDRTTLLNQFLDVKDYINATMFEDDQLVATIKQVKFLQNKSRKKIASPETINEPGFSLALLKLREFLPPRSYCTRLVTIYCRYFERTMRILHIPTFMRQCEKVWADSDPDICNSSSILPQLTAVMIMAYHMDDSHQKNEDHSHRDYLKGAAMDMVQAWLDEIPRKQRTELATLQVETLLLLSKSMRTSRPQAPEKLWSQTGALVRSAIAMGLNINPADLPGMAPYQAEMRRRLWATILEIDLQASVTCGMPLIVPEVDPAAATPMNLNDLDFDETTSPLPASQPWTKYTDNLYQVILASSLDDRLKATSLVQHRVPNLQTAVNLGRKVQMSISRIPKILSLPFEPHGTTPHDAGSLLHRVLLDLYLRRPILCLYKPLLTTITPQATPLFEEIQHYCLSSSDVVLRYQELYTIPSLATITESPWANQNFFYRSCKTDILWIALGICQHIKHLVQNNVPLTPCHEWSEQTKDNHNPSPLTLIARVQSTISCLTSRVGQKGSDLKDIVFLALALASSQLPTSTTVSQQAQVLQYVLRATLADCRENLLQPFLHGTDSQEDLNVNGPPAKRTRVSARGTMNKNVNVYPISDPTFTPSASTISDLASFPLDFSVETGASDLLWIGDFPDLAAEYNTLQGDGFERGGNSALNFGMAQDWNWEHMWQ